MSRRAIIAILVAGVGALVFALFFMSSDEDEIREKCELLEAAATFPSQRPNPALFAIDMKAKLQEVVHPEAQIVIPEVGQGPIGIEGLVGGAVRVAGNYQSAGVDLEDLKIEGLTDRNATVTARAVATAFEFGGGPPRRHERRVRLDFEKIEGEWLIVRMEAQRGEGDALAPVE